MAHEFLAWAYRQRTGSTGAKFVLIALADCGGAHGIYAPNLSRLARMTDQSTDEVHENLDYLVRAGFLKRTGNSVRLAVNPVP